MIVFLINLKKIGIERRNLFGNLYEKKFIYRPIPDFYTIFLLNLTYEIDTWFENFVAFSPLGRASCIGVSGYELSSFDLT